VGVREIETLLAERGVADAPLAARVARVSGGRPGVALAWASSPDALIERDGLVRGLLDLTSNRPAERLVAVRALAPQAGSIATAIAAATEALSSTGDAEPAPRATLPGRRRPASKSVPDDPPPSEDTLDESGPVRVPAIERRRAAEALIALWTDVARDVALCQRGLDASVRDIGALDDLRAVAGRLDQPAVTSFIDRLGRAAVLVTANVSPDTVLDHLAIAWPQARLRAA
jgi:hypothetical protein